MGSFDVIAEMYEQIVKHDGLDRYVYILDQVKEYGGADKKRICDIGCGPGVLSVQLANSGAKVTGIDLSGKMLSLARVKSDAVEWIEDDAMSLTSIANHSMDFVVSNLMLMDVPDFMAVFNQAHRVLVPGGMMIWTIMHPCFQSPFSYPLEEGGRKVSHYAPQYWKSEGEGTIRSILGAYHRPVSEYINGFQASGFDILRVDEPMPTGAAPSVPKWFCTVGRKRV
ncbi:class I SAM-dependent methyltransferase [Paenibacillus sp. MBLB4367]|uniref:class I SAM-dependent methyltransferase n=1 Tax=Paenibacillus sp. MBLB4367 TaxID=3384767 RepID=UPI003907EF9E